MKQPDPHHSLHRALEGVSQRSREAALVASTRSGRIEACNKAAERLFGHPAEQLVGSPLAMLHQDAALPEALARTLGTNGVVVTRRWMRRRDGSTFQGRIRVLSIDAPARSDVVLWLVRETAQSNVPVRSELLERDLLRLAISTKPAAAGWRAVLERLAMEFGWDYAEVWRPRSGRLRLSTHWSLDDAPGIDRLTAVSSAIDFGPGEGLPGRVWSSHDFEWLSDITEKPQSVFRRTFIARSAGLRTWFAVPAGHDERSDAIIVSASRATRELDDDVLVLTREACHCLAAMPVPGTLD